MDKKIILGLIPVMLSVMLLLTASTATAQPGPWKSKGGKVEEISAGAETWLMLPMGNGGFQLWVTGVREIHIVYLPIGQNSGVGWTESDAFPEFWYKYNVVLGPE